MSQIRVMSHPFSCTLHDEHRLFAPPATCLLAYSHFFPHISIPFLQTQNPNCRVVTKRWHNQATSWRTAFVYIKKSFRHCFYVHLCKQSVHYSKLKVLPLWEQQRPFYLQCPAAMLPGVALMALETNISIQYFQCEIQKVKTFKPLFYQPFRFVNEF